jgi:hypothetical protein
MTYDKTWIKHKEVLVDRDKGLAYVKVTLKNRLARHPVTKITESVLKKIAEEGGAEMIKVISGNTLTNRSGEASGEWVIQIPSYVPPMVQEELEEEELTLEVEEDMTPVIKKRKKSKNKNKIINEEEV